MKINRRNLLGLALPAAAATMVLEMASTAPRAEAAAKKPKTIAIAMQFVFEGKRYGLGVPIFEPTWERPLGTLEVINGHEAITLNDREMDMVIMMLQDLRSSKAESLRQLQGEGRLATKKV